MTDKMEWTPRMQVTMTSPRGQVMHGEVNHANASSVIVTGTDGRYQFDKHTRMETLASLMGGEHDGPFRLNTTEEWQDTQEFQKRSGANNAPLEWFINLPRYKRLRLIDALDNTDD